MNVTLQQLQKIMPQNKNLALFVAPLNAAMQEFEINTEQRIEMFLAQLAHESAGLTALVENLNYSKESLVKTWPTRFVASTAAPYHRQPEMIANHVYANRMGNGDKASGEGWKYRGRGAFQITGKHNYIACMMALGIDCVEHPELLEQPEAACRSAAWFFAAHGLNKVADSGDFTKMTKIINGGTIGMQHRLGLLMVAQQVIV